MADNKPGNEPTPEQVEKGQQLYADIVARYYGDPDFKAKVDANPTETLRAEGLKFPQGTKIKLLFNTQNLVHIVLPTPQK